MDPERYLREELGGLLDVLRSSDVEELELQEDELTVRIRRSAAGTHDEAIAAELLESGGEPRSEDPVVITSPLVGTFYRAADPASPPLVAEGSDVEDDTVVGIIEALNTLTDVHAGVRGRISRVLATDGHAVEYGQSLFEVEVDG